MEPARAFLSGPKESRSFAAEMACLSRAHKTQAVAAFAVLLQPGAGVVLVSTYYQVTLAACVISEFIAVNYWGLEYFLDVEG
jgi:hypothetical protein